jgi:hypothetical protein
MNSAMIRVLLLALLLGGCDVTASQERATAERVDAAGCASYGLKYGSPEYAQCRMSKDQQRQANYRAAIDQSFRNNQAVMDQQSQELQQNAQRFRQNTSQQPMNCTPWRSVGAWPRRTAINPRQGIPIPARWRMAMLSHAASRPPVAASTPRRESG